MKKVYIGLFLLLIISCSSTSKEIDVQPEAYTKIYEEVAFYTDENNTEETIVFESNEEALIYMLASERDKYNNEINDLKKQVEYYKQQSSEEKVLYVAVPIQSTGSNNSSNLLSEVRHNNTISVNSNYDFTNTITLYNYQPGKIYDVFLNPINITDIQLQAGEELITVVLGDMNNWFVEQVNSIENGNICTHVFIRPLNINISTDCEILTTKRNYYLKLYSMESSQVAIQWRYPYEEESNNKSVFTSNQPNIIVSNEPTTMQISKAVESLNFNYKITGEASWKPERVYSDTKRTYIQFNNSFLTNAETPSAYLRNGSSTQNELINYTARGITYIIPMILTTNQSIVLKSGNNEVLITLNNK